MISTHSGENATTRAPSRSSTLVAGHTGEPGAACPPSYSPTSGFTREVLSATTYLSGGSVTNYDLDNCNPPADTVTLWDYPRLHLLRSGAYFHTNSEAGHAAGFSMFMDTLNPACPATTAPERWVDQGEEMVLRHGGSSVYLISRTAADEPEEVVYILGGQDGKGDEDCCDTSTASVQRMRTPYELGQMGLWEDAPSLNFPRSNHNTVLLLNGALLAIGGNEVIPPQGVCSGTNQGQCIHHKVAEMYRPPEIFGDQSPNDQWHLVAEQDVSRRYHSTAALLPTGQVISVGGFFPDSQADPAWHSLEIYNPWYYYASRPRITSWEDPATGGVIQYRDDPQAPATYTIDVATDTVIDRVAIIRPGSVTHAFDFDQRYVELHILLDTPQAGGTRLTVQPPKDGFEAPPGFYMLVAIDDCNVPSVAKWVRVGAP